MSDAGKKLGCGLGKKSELQAEEAANPKAESGKPKAQAIAAHSFPRKESEPDSCNNNGAANNLWSNNKVAGTTSSGVRQTKNPHRVIGSA